MKWLLLFFFILIPSVVFGQEEPKGLVTCGYEDKKSGVFNPCDFCDFITMVNGLVLWLFGVLAAIAVLGLVIAGIRLVISAGNPAAMTAAKEMFTNIIIGFVIVLSAWLIVDTVIKTLVGEDSEFGMWNQFKGDCGKVNPIINSTDSGGVITGANATGGSGQNSGFQGAGVGGNAGSNQSQTPPATGANTSGGSTGNSNNQNTNQSQTSRDLSGTIYEIPCNSALEDCSKCGNGDISQEVVQRANSSTGEVEFFRRCLIE